MAWNRFTALMFPLLLMGITEGVAQVNRYVVFFRDKHNTPYTSDAPEAFLSRRAIDRRLDQGIFINTDDLPVTPAYIDAVEATGADVFFTTRWLNGVLVQCDAGLVAQINALPFVDRIEYVAPGARLVSGGRRQRATQRTDSGAATRTGQQLAMIGLDAMQNAGYRGEQIHVAVFDGGFLGVDQAVPFQHIFQDNRLHTADRYDLVTNSGNVFQYDDHGTAVFSVIAAHQEGDYVGGAYKATYHLFVTEDTRSEYRIEEYNWLFAAELADSAGVDVINASLGYYDFDDSSMNYAKSQMDGYSTVVTRAATLAAQRGMIVVCSAGNEGNNPWQLVTAPADGHDVLAVGSVSSALQRSPSSSKGASLIGAVKPDVAAMGVGTAVIRSDGTAGTLNGTSLSAPLVASLAAGVWQRYPNLTAREVVDAIRKSSSQATAPDSLVGYGIPNFQSVVNYLERTPQEETFAIFPNPVRGDSVVIRPADPASAGHCRIEILSVDGKQMVAADVDFSWLNRQHALDVTSMRYGLYFVRIQTGDRQYTFRFVKA